MVQITCCWSDLVVAGALTLFTGLMEHSDGSLPTAGPLLVDESVCSTMLIRWIGLNGLILLPSRVQQC